MMKLSARCLFFRLPRMAPFGVQSPSRQSRRRRGERGAAMVEMAISMVILLTIVFGIIKISLALYTYHYVSNAAREGARFAIVRGSACASPGYECDATAPEIQTYVQNLGYPGIDPTAMTVNTAWSPYPATAVCASPPICNGPGDLVTVTVTYKFPLSIPFVPSTILNMSSTSAMVISQ